MDCWAIGIATLACVRFLEENRVNFSRIGVHFEKEMGKSNKSNLKWNRKVQKYIKYIRENMVLAR